MELTCHSVKGINIVTLKGNLIGVEVSSTRRQIKNIIETHSPYIILDLNFLDFIDAQGLSVFVSALKAVQQCHGVVVLLNPTPFVRTSIELIRLQEIFSIYTDETAAIIHCTQLLVSKEK
ncbi:STAS domain-containing protein [Candidatus Parabeggiatoa sp. HSG14]|uniref:STAS domain-containing protein n=1 Tax=Candidatus Parabeggiatoa sp. HSG14 TaxID=3055593 RepID=UPI0025A8A75B|nr:STAS domain-containing protein [Thiotrichales bacterium HSG14]